MRRFLTPLFIDELEPPSSGERWISDTSVRGFGVRLWSYNGVGGVAYGLRSTDANGRAVRKTFHPYRDSGNNFWWRLRTGQIEMAPDGGIALSSFLDDARDWARTEKARLLGRIPTIDEERAIEAEYESNREFAGRRLRTLSVGYLVDLLLERAACRGWNEPYSDRLRTAFNAFDAETNVRPLLVNDLEDGRLVGLIERSHLGPGNLRLLRSLFNVVFWNIHDLGGPVVGHVLPSLRGIETSREKADGFLADLRLEDYRMLFRAIEEQADWRSSVAMQLSFHFWGPLCRVLGARWSQVVDGRWYPYAPLERRSWFWRYSNIDQAEFDCLDKARQRALAEGIVSDYVLPSRRDPMKPLRNIDRRWRSVLRDLGWPYLSLAKASSAFRRWFPLLEWPDLQRREELNVLVGSWGKPIVADASKSG